MKTYRKKQTQIEIEKYIFLSFKGCVIPVSNNSFELAYTFLKNSKRKPCCLWTSCPSFKSYNVITKTRSKHLKIEVRQSPIFAVRVYLDLHFSAMIEWDQILSKGSDEF